MTSEKQRQQWRERQQRRRERKRSGFQILPLEVDIVDLSENLLASGYLEYDQVENSKAVLAALHALIEDLDTAIVTRDR